MSLVATHPLQSIWPAPPDREKPPSLPARTLRERLKFCTLTGIDESVPLDALLEMRRRHPYVEFGVLYSTKQQGIGRYPSLLHIRKLALAAAENKGLNLALHVCGSAVGDLLAERGQVTELAQHFPRVQINMIAGAHDLQFVCGLLDRMEHQTVITQHNNTNKGLWRSLSHKANHAVLFDESGGKGLEPEAWESPLDIVSEKPPFVAHNPTCGYAGGLGPDNIAQHLRLVGKVTHGKPFWIDLESSLRNSADRFDLSMAQRCLNQVESVLRGTEYNCDAVGVTVVRT